MSSKNVDIFASSVGIVGDKNYTNARWLLKK